MPLIDQETSATRLARAIVADIELYNSEAIQTRADLTETIAEGRSLFRSRVAESLHEVFETILATRPMAALERRTAPVGAGRPADPRAPSAAAPPARRPMSDAYVPTESERRGSFAFVFIPMAVLLFLAAAGALVWFALRR